MFRWFRAYLGAIKDQTKALWALTHEVHALLLEHEKAGPLLERVADLELTRVQWEANQEGLVAKAQGKLSAANNAEARARTMEKHVERQLDPFAEEGEELPETRSDDAARGTEEGVQPLRLDVAPVSPKEFALRAKFS